MSRGLSRWQAVLLGTVVLGALALGGIGLFAVGDWTWLSKDTLHVQVAFPEIRGVEVGTRVRIQGLDAGDVVETRPPANPGDPVVLRLRLKGQYRSLVRADSTVAIVSEGMLGNKALEIQPGKGSGQPVEDNQLLAAGSSNDADGLLREASAALRSIQEGKGTVGKLVSEDKAHTALLELLQQGKATFASIQQVADSLEKVPLVGGYIENPVTILDRPRHSRDRRVFDVESLFEPGRAVLTTQGKRKLDEVAPWLEGMKHKGSEVVVASFADPRDLDSLNGSPRVLTRKQSEAVCEYLKGQHAIQKMGWFSSRKVVPVGLGTQPSPTVEREPLPPARVEVIVFVPQS
jgi:phospholipid/cholesterol/gamma-HCH transport system substrate-binding protein